jgi:hypothetical protein
MILKKYYRFIITLSVVSVFCISCANNEILIKKELKKEIQVEQKNEKIMEFEPEVFNGFENGVDGEYSKLSLLPLFTEHTILLVMPSKITYYIKNNKINKKELVLPLTFGYEAREKYDALDNPSTVYIKNLQTGKPYSSKMIFHPSFILEDDPYLTKEQRVSQKSIENLLPLAGQENYNILKYINLPIVAGKYQAYVTLFGLKSNVVEFTIDVK